MHIMTATFTPVSAWAVWKFIHLEFVTFPSGNQIDNYKQTVSLMMGNNRNTTGASAFFMLSICLYMFMTQNRKIRIEEAKANLEAEKLNAQAEIERAKGAAEAIRIENGSITPAYIQYLWVRQQNANTNNKIIYIPTEAGLPVLEAGRVAKHEK